MKAKLVPIYFSEFNEIERQDYDRQLDVISNLYSESIEMLESKHLGEKLNVEADAVIFPLLLGNIFDYKSVLTSINIPIIVITSPFGTVEMWDWEIVSYLREELNLSVFTPYSREIAETVFRSISAKKQLRSTTRFLLYQDTPGDGMQSNIFKRFYWWKNECTNTIKERFGVEILYKSWKEVNEKVSLISDSEAIDLWKKRLVPNESLSQNEILKAVKIYIAIKRDIDKLGNIYGVGSNCLNESFNSGSTPCLAWNWLFEYDKIIWACEGDTVTLISKFIFYSALHQPMMMTNIYPFLAGMAALRHEKLNEFPKTSDPDNYALAVHCGYFGLVPQSFCTYWMLRPKVLEIVNDDAIMLDCRMKSGPVVIAKLHSDMQTITVIEAKIEKYVQYPNSDCRNGALLRYKRPNGHMVMESLSSHHAIIIQGDVKHLLIQMAKIFGFNVSII